MKPRIVDKDQMLLVGFSFFGDPFQTSGGWTEENEVGKLWQRFMAYLMEHGSRIKHTRGDAAYEVWVETEETAAKANFEVFVGVEVEKLEDVPLELLVKVLPPTQYAVFTIEGQQIVSDWPRLVYTEWLPDLGYRPIHRFHLQAYDERFKGLDHLEGSVMEAYIPIQPPSPGPG